MVEPQPSKLVMRVRSPSPARYIGEDHVQGNMSDQHARGDQDADRGYIRHRQGRPLVVLCEQVNERRNLMEEEVGR